VLTTYVAGIPELVRSGESGWLFPAGSVEHLARAMEDCLARRPEELQAMGAAAHRQVVAQHCIDTEVAKLAQLFHAPLPATTEEPCTNSAPAGEA
jgi:glycosyltransferase involved in cell wall biosynthesis